jgi:flagellin
LKNADKILNRISELATLAQDVTKGTDDLALYQDEVSILQDQLNLMLSEQFNGIDLFDGAGSAGTTMTVVTSHDGAQTVGITQSDFATLIGSGGVGAYDVSTYSGAVAAVTGIQANIQTLANYRAVNGAEQSRLSFAADMMWTWPKRAPSLLATTSCSRPARRCSPRQINRPSRSSACSAEN